MESGILQLDCHWPADGPSVASLSSGMHSSNPPLAEAAALIEKGRFRLLSLDIFDTIVWRSFPRPTDLFYALGRAAQERGWLEESSSPEGFATLREESEALARNRKRHTAEVTLEEIYQSFPRRFLRNAGPDEVLRLELEIERAATHPNEEVVRLARYARERGLRIAFVSDTYLPEEHLRAVLPVDADFLVSSCSHGLAKTQGLHKALLLHSGVRPAQILHLGDNREADVEAPARLGITTLWFPKFPPALQIAIDSELPFLRPERAHCLSGAGGDYGITSLRSQALHANANVADPYRAWGATVLGPAMAGFCGWILRRCREMGVREALYLMREGRVLRRMTRRLDPSFRALEFHISRFVAVKACILSGTFEELLRFLARPSPAPAAELLADLAIDATEAGVAPDALIEGDAARELARAIHSKPDLRRRAVEASRELRRRLLAHLFQVLPEPPATLAVVDLGYAGTIQQCLQQILDHEGLLTRTHGLYLVTNRGIGKLQRAGAAAESYLADQDQPVWFSHPFTRCPETVEQSLMCDCGTTIGYAPDGTPVTGEIRIPDWQREAIASVQAGAFDFIERWAERSTRCEPEPERLRSLIRFIVVRALTSPTEAEIEAFGSWHHDENFGSHTTRTLTSCRVPDLYLRHMSAHQLASLRSGDVYWVFGLARHLSPVLGEAVKCIFLRKAPPEAFHAPLPEACLRFCWDDGSAHQSTAHVWLSNRGTVWNRFTLQFRQASLTSIGIAVDEHPAGFDLTGAALRLVERAECEKVLWIAAGSFRDESGAPILPGNELRPGTRYVAPVVGVADFTGIVHVDLFFLARVREHEPCLC